MNPPTALPGWYPDPSGGQRYWDGTQWSSPTRSPVVVNNIVTRPVFITRRPSFLAVIACLFLFRFIADHWQVVLVLVVLAALGYVWHTRTEHQTQIAARADQAYRSDPTAFLYPPTMFGTTQNRHEKD